MTVLTVAVLVQGIRPSPGGHRSAVRAVAGQEHRSETGGQTTRRPATAAAGHRLPGGTAAATEAWAGAGAPASTVVNLGSDGPTPCAGNTYQQLILVSISSQHLWACAGATQVDQSPVTTGAADVGDQTPLGSWRLQAKQQDRYLVGPGYRDFVRYWMPFDGDFGLHDASWQTMPYGSPGWPAAGSHGCVHTPLTVIAWLYRWSVVGHTVVTIES